MFRSIVRNDTQKLVEKYNSEDKVNRADRFVDLSLITTYLNAEMPRLLTARETRKRSPKDRKIYLQPARESLIGSFYSLVICHQVVVPVHGFSRQKGVSSVRTSDGRIHTV